jgi:phage terminase large subunit
LTCLATPGVRALAVRKTLVSLTASGLVTYREHVAKYSILAGDVVWFGGSRQEPASYRYSNGSRLVVGGMDDITKVMSSEYDICYVQEATELQEDEWEKLTTRLRNHKISFQQLLADCNPDAPTHWLLQRTYKGLTKMLESRHEDNPTLFNDDGTLTESGADYIGKLDRLTGVRYYRLRQGLWVAAEGVIYDEFDPAVHLVDFADIIPGGKEIQAKGKKLTARDIPEEWPRFWAVDFGYVNPMVIQCWAEDPDGQLIMYRELYQTRKTVDQHAKDILDVVAPVDADGKRKWIEPKPRAVICDHDAENRAVLARELNLPTKPANKKVKKGIEAVQRRLRPRADGRPGIVFVRDAVMSRDQELVDAKKPAGTIEEFPSYVWDIRDGGKTKDEPVKEDDHGMDTTRYLVMYRDPEARPGMRVL